VERLKTLDTEFLHVEDGIAHMHIAGACVFADPPPTYDEFFGLIAGKMHLIPQYRQRVRPVPVELGRPVWADDPHFDLHYHVRHTALPAPGDDAALRRLMGRLMSQPLDRERPLWEAWLVEGLEGGRWAGVFKVHHSMVDGIAGVALLTVLLDLFPDAQVLEPEPWTPEPEPDALEKVVDAWKGLAADAGGALAQVGRAVTDPADAARTARRTVRGIGRLLGSLGGTPPSSIDGAIGPHRAWAHASADLAAIKTIRRVFGGTVNDVVLAAVSGGYRDLLIAHGDDPDTAVVRSLVPVSTRREDGEGRVDNRVSAILATLPVEMADPVDRLMAVQAQMGEHKQSHMAEAGEVVTSVGDLVPPVLIGSVSRAVTRVLRELPQRSITTVTTNVPGPQFPLYCLGREMLEYRPYVPIFHGVRVATAILSYNGRVFFGVTGDYESTPDVDVLALGAAAAVNELLARAEHAEQVAAEEAAPRRGARTGSKGQGRGGSSRASR
jgi:WS/DGAT/MGAT family acyltransferase